MSTLLKILGVLFIGLIILGTIAFLFIPQVMM